MEKGATAGGSNCICSISAHESRGLIVYLKSEVGVSLSPLDLCVRPPRSYIPVRIRASFFTPTPAPLTTYGRLAGCYEVLIMAK